MGRLLGIDYGDKRFGLAVSDPTQTLARPLETIEGQSEFWRRLEVILADGEIETLVLGLPRNMDGSLGPKAQTVLAFRKRLEERSGLPVETWDERLTTVQAERNLRETGMSLNQRRRRVDEVAAQIILQSFIDRKQAHGEA